MSEATSPQTIDIWLIVEAGLDQAITLQTGKEYVVHLIQPEPTPSR